MRKLITAAIILMIFSGTAFGQEKSNWYIGFGVGTGQLQIEGETMDDAFSDYNDIDVDPELALHFGVGGILNPKVHLGFDGSFIRQTADGPGGDFTLQVNNYLAAVTFYPMEKGLLLKAGLGLATIMYDLDTDTIDESDTYGGMGFLLGIGYDFWLGKSFNLGIHAEYSRQSYNDSDAPDDTEFASVYLTFYWF